MSTWVKKTQGYRPGRARARSQLYVYAFALERRVCTLPMRNSPKLVKVLLTNIAIAVAISLTASYIGVSGAGVPAEAFVPAFLGTSLANIGMSYVISFFVGWFIPAERLGFGFAMKCGLKPTDGLKFGAALNVVVNTIYVAFNSVILTYVNACVMNGAPLAAYPAAFASSILQCWIVGYVVSLFWAPQCEKWARAICKDPEPQMH